MSQIERATRPERIIGPGPPPPPPSPAEWSGPPRPAPEQQATKAEGHQFDQAIVRIDPKSVLDLSLRFFRRMLLIGIGVGVVGWVVAWVTGLASSIDTFIQDLSGYPSLTVLGAQGLLVAVVLGLTFVLGGALLAVLGVVLFNLASDLGGGIKMTVMETELDESLVGPKGAASLAESGSSGPRPLAHRGRSSGAARRGPVLGANVTSVDGDAAAGPAGSRPSADDERATRVPLEQEGRPPRVRRGALVVGVERDSPADSVGLVTGDVIVSADGSTVDSPAALSSVINRHETDAAFDMSWVDQQGRYQTAIVRFGHRSR